MALRRNRWYHNVVSTLAELRTPPKKLINPWNVVKVLHNPWRRLDCWASRYREDVHHRFLDSFIGTVRGKNIFFPHGFFPDGFGDPSVPVMFTDSMQEWAERRTRGELPHPVHVRWPCADAPPGKGGRGGYRAAFLCSCIQHVG